MNHASGQLSFKRGAERNKVERIIGGIQALWNGGTQCELASQPEDAINLHKSQQIQFALSLKSVKMYPLHYLPVKLALKTLNLLKRWWEIDA